MFVQALSLLSVLAGYDVQSAEARRRNLIEYIGERQDLSGAEQKEWEQAVRLAFGGKALKSGEDEGVTVAKSVLSAGIFYGVAAKKAATAAYEAYHDTYRWVPPPIAINYQVLTFEGRRPTATARQLAYSFPRYFNEELAPEVVVWWDDMLARDAINELERPRIRELLAETRELMRPLLLAKLYQAAELKARQESMAPGDLLHAEVKKALSEIDRELARELKEVGGPEARNLKSSYYTRYLALAAELKSKPRPRPVVRAQPPPAAEARPSPPARPSPNGDVLADAKESARDEQRLRREESAPAPLAGDALLPVRPGMLDGLRRVVQGWLGTPYLYGGLSKRGVDCSAFSRAVYREWVAVDLPRSSRDQYRVGVPVTPDGLRPGDLIFFDTLERGHVTHVGVYLGEGRFAHASSTKGVAHAELNQRYYQRAYWGSKRLLRH